jgi:hypothetical protein
MTSEKLAAFRAKGMLLDTKFDRLAMIGDKKKAEQEKDKSITIKYVSCRADDKNYHLTFEVSAKNLKTDKATIFVEEMNYSNEEVVPITKVDITTNGKKNISVPFLKSLEKTLDNYFWQSGFVYQATLICDGITETTNEFSIKCVVAGKKEECEKVKVQALKLTDLEKAKFISTVLSETNMGSEYLRDIAWVYYNRVDKYGVENKMGLNASNAYRNKNKNFKLCMYYLGKGNEYANFKYDGVILSKYVKENGWFTKKIVPNITKMKTYIDEAIFSKTPETCFKGWIGQGYWADLDYNPEDGYGDKWYMARQYFWLQLQKKVTTKYVHIMRDGNATSFIFDEDNIKKFFDKNSKLLPEPKKVKKFYNNGTLDFDL